MPFFEKNFRKKTDEELMLLLTKGGQSAFDELYERYSKPMLNFFFRMMNNDLEKSEDMLHDLFLKIIEKPESFDPSRKFSTWFYTLANNMIKNEYRSLQIRKEHLEQNIKNQTNVFDLNNEKTDTKLFHQRLQIELNKLDTDIKMLFECRFVEEMSVKQIAEIMDCPEGTVKSRLYNLTKLLSKKLEIYKPELN